jgi:putative transposase
MPDNKWARLLAYVTGLVNQKLLLQNEYLAAENRILRAHLSARCPCRITSDPPWLKSVSDSAGLRFSRSPVSPNPIPSSPGTGGSLPANSTAPNSVLLQAGPASRPNWKRSLCASPERAPSGDMIASSEPWPISATLFPIRPWETSLADTGSGRHQSGARISPGRISSPPTRPCWQVPTSSQSKCSPGEVSPPTYVLFFIHLESRRVSLAGLTKHPTAEWMLQMARNATDESSGSLRGLRYLRHDRDTMFCAAFLEVLRSSGIRPLAGGSVQNDDDPCTRSAQGKGNLLLFPSPDVPLCPKRRTVRCRDRLGGLLKFYSTPESLDSLTTRVT